MSALIQNLKFFYQKFDCEILGHIIELKKENVNWNLKQFWNGCEMCNVVLIVKF